MAEIVVMPGAGRPRASTLPGSDRTREAVIGDGTALMGRQSDGLAAFCARVEADWRRASADLELSITKLRSIRAFTDRCNAAYAPDGTVDPAAYERLKAEFEGSRAALAAE